MAWVAIPAVAPELSLHVDGKLVWNTGLHILLGGPVWVKLMWDSVDRRLGVRAVSAADGFLVAAKPEKSEFMIDSAGVLSAAGISVARELTVTPGEWTNLDANGLVDPLFGYPYGAIFYLTLPE